MPLWGAIAVGSTALIGTDGHGYYTAPLDGDLAVTRLALTTEAIYHASILRLWVDPVDAGRVFALTASDGLWFRVGGRRRAAGTLAVGVAVSRSLETG